MFRNRTTSCFAENNYEVASYFFLAGSFATANKLHRSCFQVMWREVAYGPQLSPKTRGREGDRHVQRRCIAQTKGQSSNQGTKDIGW